MTRILFRKFILVISLCGGFADAWALVTIQVDSNVDEVDNDVMDGVCHTASGKCTLRAAIMTANRETFPTQINLPAGTYTLSIAPVVGEDETSGDLNLTAPTPSTNVEIEIDGAGVDATVVDGAGLSRVFSIGAKRGATFRLLTIRGGTASGDEGGGILNYGILSLDHVNVVGNSSDVGGGIANYGALALDFVTTANNIASLQGGGIDNEGTLEVINSTVSGNVSQDVAGGIAHGSGQLIVINSTLDSNSASNGGALETSGLATIENTTFSNNSATDGGAILGLGELTMINSTIADNHAANNGGGLYRYETGSGAWNVYNSTIAYNDADSDADHNGSGGGIYVMQESGVVGTLNIYNTLVAGNTVQDSPQPDDCSGNGVLNTQIIYSGASRDVRSRK